VRSRLRPGDTLVVSKLDRMGRDMREIMETAWSLQDLGAKLEILSGPLAGAYDPRGMGKMFFALLAGFAELEREMMTERTNDGLAQAAAEGRHGGRPPVISRDMMHIGLGPPRRRRVRDQHRQRPGIQDRQRPGADGLPPYPLQRLPRQRRRTGRRDRIAEPSRTAVRHGSKICSLWLLASPWLDPLQRPHRDAHDGSTTDSYFGAGDTDPNGGPSRPTRK
jgi:hypothetical protein